MIIIFIVCKYELLITHIPFSFYDREREKVNEFNLKQKKTANINSID